MTSENNNIYLHNIKLKNLLDIRKFVSLDEGLDKYLSSIENNF